MDWTRLRGCSHAPRVKAIDPTILGNYLPLLQAGDRETLAVIHLDSTGEIIARRVTQDASLCAVQLPLRAIVADALNLGTRRIILAHNHPSGFANPSCADITATRALSDVLASLEIRLDDHFVVTATDIFSFADAGLV